MKNAIEAQLTNWRIFVNPTNVRQNLRFFEKQAPEVKKTAIKAAAMALSVRAECPNPSRDRPMSDSESSAAKRSAIVVGITSPRRLSL